MKGLLWDLLWGLLWGLPWGLLSGLPWGPPWGLPLDLPYGRFLGPSRGSRSPGSGHRGPVGDPQALAPVLLCCPGVLGRLVRIWESESVGGCPCRLRNLRRGLCKNQHNKNKTTTQ